MTYQRQGVYRKFNRSVYGQLVNRSLRRRLSDNRSPGQQQGQDPGGFQVTAIPDFALIGNGEEFRLEPDVGAATATSWSFSGLPTDWTGDTATGVIEGTLFDPIAAQTITVSATDGADNDDETFNLTVTDPPNALAALPNGTLVLLIGSGQSNWVSTIESVPAYNETPIANSSLQNSAGSFVAFSHNATFTRLQDYFAQEFESVYPNLRLIISEFGDGGNGFENGAGTFAPGGSAQLELYENVENAYQRLRLGNLPFVVWGMIWIHGNADSNTDADAAAYASQLTNFFQGVRDLVGGVLNVVSHRFWAPTYDSGSASVVARIQQIRDAAVALSQGWINLDDITDAASGLGTDNIHYNQAGNRKNALRAFNALQAQPAPTLIDPNVGIHVYGLDITSAAALPAEITEVDPDGSVFLNPSTAVGLRIRRNAALSYGTHYIRTTNPVSWNFALNFLIRTPTNVADANVIGLSNDPAGWDARTDQTTFVWRADTGNLLVDNTVVDTFGLPGQGVSQINRYMNLEFVRSGDDIVVSAYDMAITTLDVFPSIGTFFRLPLTPFATYTWVGGALTLNNPIMFIDAAGGGTDMRLVLFKEAIPG